MPARTDNFQKFVKQKKGSAIKEEIKQQKKKEKKERAKAIDEHYAKKRTERLMQQPASEPSKGGRQNKYPKKDASSSPVKSSRPNKYPQKNIGVQGAQAAKSDTPFKGKAEARTRIANPNTGKKFPAPVKSSQANTTAAGEKILIAQRDQQSLPGKLVKKSPVNANAGKSVPKAPVESKQDTVNSKAPRQIRHPKQTDDPKNAPVHNEGSSGEQMPLNKYIAHGGICSRRDAAQLVKDGKVNVNGVPATDPGMKVSSSDVVKVGNKRITPSKNFVYILLNKPKDYITTSEDPQGRKTVLDLVRSATSERVYPVGRLDRNTSGVLLLTNDGELAQKLSHPKHEIKKVYEVRLDRSLTKGDMDKIANGITLEDGFVAPDVIAYADAKDKSIIGVEIHSGRNRIVRRIFEHLTYDVKGLDRVMFAGLTKKDVQRGKWRFLKDREIRILKFMNQSFIKIRE